MKKIDIHTHILPDRIPKFMERFGYGGFIQMNNSSDCRATLVFDDGRHFRDIKDNCWNPVQRLKDCDEAGVGIQVLSTVPVMFSYWARAKDTLEIHQYLNDHIAGVVEKFPNRFRGLGAIPMQDPGLAIGELERCVTELGLNGVEIGTHVEGKNLDDPMFMPFFKAAEGLDAAIFVHPWDMLGSERMKKHWLGWLVGMPTETALAIASMVLGGVFERAPKLKVAFAHGGGSYSSLFGRLDHGFLSRPDLVARESSQIPSSQLGQFFVDSIVHDPEVLRHAIRIFGVDKVLLGSDYPFPLGEERPGALIESLTELSLLDREKLLARNALNWLGETHASL